MLNLGSFDRIKRRVHGIFLSGLCVCVNLNKDNLKKQSLIVGQPLVTFFPQALHFDNDIAKHYVAISKNCCIV